MSESDETSRSWNSRGALPVAAGVLVALNGLYLLLVAFGNITDFDTNRAFVRGVLSMETTNFGAEAGTDLDDDVMWRAITSEPLQDVAYLGIIAWEGAAAMVLLFASLLWFRGGHAGVESARRWSTAGLLMAVLLFFGGFIVIGGEWFQMWRSTTWNGLDPAFRNTVLAVLTLIVVYLPDVAGTRHEADHW